MQITLDARMGLTQKALDSAPAYVHLSNMRESLCYLPTYAQPLKDVCSGPGIAVLAVMQSDPSNFPVRLSMEIPSAHLSGADMREKIASGQTLVRAALSNMDTVLNGDAVLLPES